MIAHLLCRLFGHRWERKPSDPWVTTRSACPYCGGPDYLVSTLCNDAGQVIGSMTGCPDCCLRGTLDPEHNAAMEKARREVADLAEKFWLRRSVS